jgi:hypothetical protein
MTLNLIEEKLIGLVRGTEDEPGVVLVGRLVGGDDSLGELEGRCGAKLN